MVGRAFGLGENANPDAVGARFTYQAGDLLPSRRKVGDGSLWSVRNPRRVLGMGNRKTRAAGEEVAAAQRSWRSGIFPLIATAIAPSFRALHGL